MTEYRGGVPNANADLAAQRANAGQLGYRLSDVCTCRTKGAPAHTSAKHNEVTRPIAVRSWEAHGYEVHENDCPECGQLVVRKGNFRWACVARDCELGVG